MPWIFVLLPCIVDTGCVLRGTGGSLDAWSGLWNRDEVVTIGVLVLWLGK